MLMGELATIAKYNLPIKVIILKNNSFGMIKAEQIAQEGNPEYGVDLYPIDFTMYARACGVVGFMLDDPSVADVMIRQALEAPGPALIEAVIDPYELPLPGHINSQQAFHFTEAMLKGEKDRWDIIKTLVEDKIREVV
jgi:pyruvate dehydrogenase (quinone)